VQADINVQSGEVTVTMEADEAARLKTDLEEVGFESSGTTMGDGLVEALERAEREVDL
jgi:hypothetical protein